MTLATWVYGIRAVHADGGVPPGLPAVTDRVALTEAAPATPSTIPSTAASMTSSTASSNPGAPRACAETSCEQARTPVDTSPAALAWRTRIDATLRRLATTQSDTETKVGAAVHLAAMAPEVSTTQALLTRRLRAIVRSRPSGARVSVHVRDLDTDEVLFDHHGDRLHNPASTQKLLTATAAVELLGPDYRFETTLHRRGDLLYLRGEGDPSLQLEDLYGLVARADLGDAAIREVIVDDGAFTDARYGPGYTADGPDPSYLAPSGAVSTNFNTVEVVVTGGSTPTIDVTPRSAAVTVRDETRRRGGPLRVTTEPAPDGAGTLVRVRGTPPRQGRRHVERRRIAAPSMFTGGVVANLVAELHDQPVPTVRRGGLDDHARRVSAHRSSPLASVLTSALTFSNNFSMEQILRAMAWRATGTAGSWEQGLAVLERYWAAIGGDPKALVVVNGAGLSRGGRLHARGLVRLLDRIHRPGSQAHLLAPAMARPGRDGTLRGRLRDVGPDLIAKTGTLAGHSGLAGMISVDRGHELGFAVLVDGASTTEARALQDRVARALHQHLQRAESASERPASAGRARDAFR